MVGEPGFGDIVAPGEGLGEGEETVEVLDFVEAGWVGRWVGGWVGG